MTESNPSTPADDPSTTAVVADAAMVLLIDDQTIVGEAVRRLFAGEPDIDFHYTSDPAGAITLASRLLPTVILQDLVMPGVEGIELLRRFRGNPATAETPIIVLSTKEDPRVKRDAFAAGASDYLVKLPDRIELLARVRYHSQACLNQRRRNEIAAALRESQRALADRVLELSAALEEIRRLEREKTDFYSMVTHDLRNPAGNVRVAMTMLLEGKAGPLSPTQERLISLAARGADKLMRLINDYLDYATIDAGYLKLERADCDIVALAREAVAGAAAQASVRRQHLGIETPAEPVRIFADAGKLEQVLDNLISNAIKYTPEDGAIRVSVERMSNGARLRVRDNGPGIDPAFLGSLFAKYQRVPGAASRGVVGTGLGLLIAKEIVEGHAGTIRAESTGVPGEGTEFIVELPVGTP